MICGVVKGSQAWWERKSSGSKIHQKCVHAPGPRCVIAQPGMAATAQLAQNLLWPISPGKPDHLVRPISHWPNCGATYAHTEGLDENGPHSSSTTLCPKLFTWRSCKFRQTGGWTDFLIMDCRCLSIIITSHPRSWTFWTFLV